MRRKANGPNKTAIYQLKFDHREINRRSEFAKVTFTVRPSSEQAFGWGVVARAIRYVLVKCFSYHGHLQLIVKLDLSFKFGDASLRALLKMTGY